MEDDLVRPIRVVSARDEAIDWQAMWDASGVSARVYAETRDDESVRVLPGMHLRWCTLQPLSGPDMLSIESMPETTRAWHAFRISVSEVQSFEVPGFAIRPEMPAAAPAGGTRMIWTDAALQRIANKLGLRFIFEIGAIAHERALEGNGRSGGVLFTPPLFLQPALDLIVRRTVALAMASAGTRSSDKSAPAATTTSSSSSGAATDAPAASGGEAPAEKAPTTSPATLAKRSSEPSKKRRARG